MTTAILLKKTAIWLNTLSAPSIARSAITGTSQSVSQRPATASARAALGRAWAGSASPSTVSAAAISLPPPALWPPRELECLRTARRARQADQAGPQDDDRKRNVEEEDADERGRRQRAQNIVLERPPADAEHGLQHDGEHRRLEAEERRGHQRDIAERRIDVAQPHDGHDAGHHEQPARHQAAERAMHQPADIGRELLRLRAGQQHAIVERMQEAPLGDPALLLDHDAMHHRDLAGRAAEAQERDPQPDPQRRAQRDRTRRRWWAVLHARELGHAAPPGWDRHQA